MKRILFAGAALVLAACGGNPEPTTPQPAAAVAAETTPDTVAIQLAAGRNVESIVFEPARLELTRGDSVRVVGRLLDANGQPVTGARWGVQDAPGTDARSTKDELPNSYMVRATGPAEGVLRAFVAIAAPNGQPAWRPVAELPVVVHDYAIARIDIEDATWGAYVGTAVPLAAKAITTHDTEREAQTFTWRSETPSVATVSDDGMVRFIAPGTATIVAEAEGISDRIGFEVRANPVRQIRITAPRERLRTGDVAHLDVQVLDARGRAVDDVRLAWEATPAGSAAGNAEVFEDGAFVAEDAGSFRITASAGDVSANTQLTVAQREVHREASLVGMGEAGTASSDLWVFEGLDGRDYVYTGTMSAATMFAWDVTDPANPVKTDSVTLDGRRINDVKIHEGRHIAIATSEGASNRRNGMTLLDISDPAHPSIITHYTEDLTGGVHNVWFDGDIVYVVNDGTLDVHIVDIADPANPVEIGRWGHPNPGRYLHDVSVWDGLAYLSYWDDGVVILDVGNGVAGGSPSNPQYVSSYKYRYEINGETYGNTHHALPFTNEAGRRYLFVSDEIFGCPDCEGPRGYVHVLDATDMTNLVEVAKYEVSQAGTHNMWIEDDMLYLGYYQAGLRVLDISGELRGDLLAQGREIAHYDTDLEGGENTTMAWGAQPYKGNVFVSDMATGLWVVKLEPQSLTP